MLVSCKCLNIRIKTKNNPIKFDTCSLGAGHDTSFFLKELLICEPMVITNRQEVLVYEEKVCEWITYKCLNCNLLCYAKSIVIDEPEILINPDSLTDSKQVEELKNSVFFSQTYQIIINKYPHAENSEKKPRSIALLPPQLKLLHQQLIESVDNETKLVEDKIRKFTEKQYSGLDEFRTKAENEYKSLSQILSEKTDMNIFDQFPNQTSSKKKLSPTRKLPKSAVYPFKKNPTINLVGFVDNSCIQNNENGASSKTSRINIPKGRGSNDSVLLPASYDAEGVFPIEDMDDIITDYGSDDFSESDSESRSRDENISFIPHLRQLEMATSLPVDVPKFIVNRSSGGLCDLDEQIRIGRKPQYKTDIAASIKALAKSVHGDRIFGELPRPRLGSEI